MFSNFSDAGYLMPRPPIRDHVFFEQPELQRLLGDNLLQLLRLPLRPTPWYYGRSRMEWRILV
jgi:hypothetical protein